MIISLHWSSRMVNVCDQDDVMTKKKPLYAFPRLCNFGVYFVINTLRPRQDGRHFADDIFKCIFLNEKVWIPIKISLKFVPKGSINNNPALFQMMAWRRPGVKPLSEPMLVFVPTHICVTRPQWVNQTSLLNKQSSWRLIAQYNVREVPVKSMSETDPPVAKHNKMLKQSTLFLGPLTAEISRD